MPDEPEVIRQRMEETRASLAEKLETLEQHVVQTVTGTTAAVSETVENVKEAVQETVDAVKGSVHDSVTTLKQAFDPARQMEEHPWLFMAGAVAVGYWSGRMVQNGHALAAEEAGYCAPVAAVPPLASTRPEMAQERRPGFLDTLASEFSGELNRVKALALGAGLALVRDLAMQAAPENLKPRIEEIADSITVKLGGEVIPGPIWPANNQ
jgi:ElaB/YqjD/DUF883 family membrane-anchored ribosome-binding protein